MKNGTKKPTTLSTFLKECTPEKDSTSPITNTRIGNTGMNIYPGKYSISQDRQEEFLNLYLQHINKGNTEYLTETQLETNSPILIDIDLRFDYNVKTRMYTDEDIEELRNLYLEELKKIYQFDEQPFYFYIFEKTNVNVVEDKKITKDGIHMIIGVKSKREEQIYLREKVMSRVQEIWSSFPIVNTWEEVFDVGITKGTCGWQLYGSTKPGFEPYKLTKQYRVVLDESDRDLIITEEKIPEKMTIDLLKKLSARCDNHPFYFNRNDFVVGKSVSPAKTNTRSSSLKKITNDVDLSQIKDRESLINQVSQFLENIEITNFGLKETYHYTMALPEKYYGTGSYPHWIKVGIALRNISDKLFIVWVEFSAKWQHFDFSSIPDMYEKWVNFDTGNPNGMTRRSIMHWLKMDNVDDYNRIRRESIEYYINESLKNPKCGDVDIANVLYEFYKDQFVCVSIKGNIWYHFTNHRWKLDESGTSLRERISGELRKIYQNMVEEKKKKLMTASDEEKEKMTPMISKIQEVVNKLGATGQKDNIMKEAKEKFFDKGGVFMKNLDTNPYILCFTNGVVDFRDKTFRDGRPEDCVSLCTQLKFVPLDENTPTAEQKRIMNEINDFMHKLFPLDEIYEYMWEHLASVLIGTSSDQTFHMYIGEGSNGKSVLMELMSKTLGEYKGDVPLSVITDKRAKVGGLTPELVELRGRRYAVMQEPSPDEKINVGPMKMLTGGDKIQCRAPFMPETVKYIPQFKLCLCTNTLMKIPSQDNGTWRRIRVVKFMSSFTSNPDPKKMYQFKAEEGLDVKFESWKEIFISMLVNVARRTNGTVKICDSVLQSSNEYKGEQDMVGLFVSEMIVNDPNGKINQIQLKTEFDKWYLSKYDDRGKPKTGDLYDYFNKHYGKIERNGFWKEITFVRCEVEDEDEEPQNETFTSS